MKLFMVISERRLEIMHENKKKDFIDEKKNHNNIFFLKREPNYVLLVVGKP